MYPNRHIWSEREIGIYERGALVSPNMKSFLYARVICTTGYIFIELQIERAAGQLSGIFGKSGKNYRACGWHRGLFKRPLAISINGARAILDLPTCCRARSCALTPIPLLLFVVIKVSRSNNPANVGAIDMHFTTTVFFYFYSKRYFDYTLTVNSISKPAIPR